MAFVGFDVSMSGFSKPQRLPLQEFLSTSIGVLHAKLRVKFEPKNSRLFQKESWPSCPVYLVINGGYLFLFAEGSYGYAFLVGDASKELKQTPRRNGSNYSSISLPFMNAAVSLKLEFMDDRTHGTWWTILNTLLNSEVDYGAIQEVAPEAFSKNLPFVVKAYPQYGGTEVGIRCYRAEGYEESPPPQDVQSNEEASDDSSAATQTDNTEEEKEEGETSSNESYHSAQNVVRRADDFYHVFERLHKENTRHWLFDSRAASPPSQDELQNISNGTQSSTRTSTSKNAAVQTNMKEKEMKDLFDHLGLTSSSAHTLLQTIEVLSKKLSAVINQEPTSSSLPQNVPGSSAVNQASLSQMKSNDQAAAGASRRQTPPIKEVSAPKPPATQKSRSPTPRIPASQPAKRGGRQKKTPQEVEVAPEQVQEEEVPQVPRMTTRQAAIAARKADEAARRAEQEANDAAEAEKASKKTPVPKKKPVDDPKKKPPAGSKNKN